MSVGTPLLWAGFTAVVVALLLFDLGIFHRKSHVVGIREALGWTGFWIALALSFNVLFYFWVRSEQGPETASRLALEFFTGYLLEKALSVDNLFVFLVIFTYFGVPAIYQHRVLFWGILGALVMRAGFILAGAALIHSFAWILYIFGGFLVLTALKLMFQKGEEVHPDRNPLLRLFRKLIRSVPDYRGSHFFVREGGAVCATPLVFVLFTIETTDVVFATDSIPAVFGVTTDPFIVYTSNIFAILGLRALFFVLAGMLGKFRYLKVGLALVLGFIGVKMLIVELYKIPIGLSLGVVGGVIGLSVVASLLHPEPPPKDAPADHLPEIPGPACAAPEKDKGVQGNR